MASLKYQKSKIKERASKGGRKRIRIQPAAGTDSMLFCSRRNLFSGNPPKTDKANTQSFSASLS